MIGARCAMIARRAGVTTGLYTRLDANSGATVGRATMRLLPPTTRRGVAPGLPWTLTAARPAA